MALCLGLRAATQAGRRRERLAGWTCDGAVTCFVGRWDRTWAHRLMILMASTIGLSLWREIRALYFCPEQPMLKGVEYRWTGTISFYMAQKNKHCYSLLWNMLLNLGQVDDRPLLNDQQGIWHISACFARFLKKSHARLVQITLLVLLWRDG